MNVVFKVVSDLIKKAEHKVCPRCGKDHMEKQEDGTMVCQVCEESRQDQEKEQED